ncbi:CHASE2 domain-containing protein [Microcoleus sp. FACHB-1515]|uniref:sensor histidine kinase n=1 Tax=Cyanophyceae TaxID=3028117 RepID=UPI0016875042|nr:CHASE2 domain-containing protein [Microcoleus sp. FACHB-1515]MBD2088927.1 CHASE2 domain-containing protein [Microcoleus sp. FACHB-1515]
MRQTFQDRFKQELKIWRIGALPGLLVIALVIAARFTGNLQNAEWFAFDLLLRSRPSEPTDDRILIVGIDEVDIRQMKTYPIPDREIAKLIQTLQQHQPAVIGLDIFRDFAVEPGHLQLENLLRSNPNIIGVERVLESETAIAPPEALPPEQVGFADAVLDQDGFLRRSLLGIPISAEEFKVSLTIRLAERYLAKQNITLENGIQDPLAMRFGDAELTRFQANAGGYVSADAGGIQTLINFRSGDRPFHFVPLRDVTSGQVPDDWIRDRIVLIGITAVSFKDVVNTAAVRGNNPGLVNGVEVQAHAISQIISAALDNRPLLKVWPDSWEYVWIVGWGLFGISLGRVIRSPLKLVAGLAIACCVLVSICYGLLMAGWWLPLVPAFLVLFLNGAGITAALFYRHEQNLRARLRDRQLIIDQTFDAIHNGPLQTLAKLLRQSEMQSSNSLQTDLKVLNRELREVYDSMRREALVQGDRFHLSSNQELDLNLPLHEVLFEVYEYTLERDLPYFQQIKLNITTFEPLDDRALTVEQKRGICRFLEEALCNVGKHAKDVTRLDVICKLESDKNLIRIVDNGMGDRDYFNLDHVGRGTQQAKELARELGGQFQRSSRPPQGTICELAWPPGKPWHRWFRLN